MDFISVDEAAAAPYALAAPQEKQCRHSLLRTPTNQPLFGFVEEVRAERHLTDEMPYFDPCDGGINARVLFLLEAPGPGAVASGFISRNNPDPTARNMCELMAHAQIDRKDTLLWNIVPWYLGVEGRIAAATKTDVDAGATYLERLLGLLPRLEVIVLVGKKAQSAAPEIRRLTRLPFRNTHHMSARVFNAWPEKKAETESDFRAVAALLRDKKTA